MAGAGAGRGNSRARDAGAAVRGCGGMAGTGAERAGAETGSPAESAEINWLTDHQWLAPAADMAAIAVPQIMGTVEDFIVCAGLSV